MHQTYNSRVGQISLDFGQISGSADLVLHSHLKRATMKCAMKLKILTYNIHKGFDWGKKNYFLEEIKKLIKTSKANLVFLQEVVGESNKYKRKGLIDKQFEFIAESVWTHYSYAQNAVHDHGHHGNLILSEFPIASTKNFNISTNKFEKRGLLVCKITLPNKPLSKVAHKAPKYLHVICAHLDLLSRGRQKQYQMLKDLIDTLDLSETDPLIIAGDFNDWNKEANLVLENDLQMTEVHKSHYGLFAKTFPAFLPVLSLDRIYVRNMKIKNSYVISKTSKNHFSDHLPLFCEVELGET